MAYIPKAPEINDWTRLAQRSFQSSARKVLPKYRRTNGKEAKYTESKKIKSSTSGFVLFIKINKMLI